MTLIRPQLLAELQQERLQSVNDCCNAAAALGPLAPWWMRPEILERVDRIADRADPFRNRPLPSGEGCVNLLLVVRPLDIPHSSRPADVVSGGASENGRDSAAAADSCLRAGVVLPVRWKRETLQDPRLPPPLAVLANDIVQQFQEDPAVKSACWHLHVGVDADLGGLTDNDFTTGSAWAPLAAGLLLAARRLHSEPHVWATGAWDPRGGVAMVHGLRAKLDTARDCGAREVFVPAANATEARDWCDDGANGVKLGFLPVEASKPVQALDGYLARLGHPPHVPREGNKEDLQRCVSFYEQLPNKDDRRRPFYLSHLLPILVKQHQDAVHDKWSNCRPDFHVTVVSNSPEMVMLNVLVSGAGNCLLLCSNPKPSDQPDSMKPYLDQVKDYLTAEGSKDVAPRRFDLGPYDILLRQFETHLAGFLPIHVKPEQVLFDLTPGTKPMTLALSRLARPGNWLLYLGHVYSPERRAEAGTEEFQLWQVGSPGP